jgi:hypothetical protein
MMVPEKKNPTNQGGMVKKKKCTTPKKKKIGCTLSKLHSLKIFCPT